MFDFSRLDKLLTETGISKAHLCSLVGRERYYIRDAKNKAISIPDSFVQIWADALHTTPEYLKGETDEKEKPTAINGDGLSEIMKKIISGSSKLPEEKQLLVLELIKSMKEDQ